MDFRQYDSAIGRFNGMDRLSEMAYGISPYRFAFNNPIMFSDPTGLIEESVLLDMFEKSGSGKTVWTRPHGFVQQSIAQISNLCPKSEEKRTTTIQKS